MQCKILNTATGKRLFCQYNTFSTLILIRKNIHMMTTICFGTTRRCYTAALTCISQQFRPPHPAFTDIRILSCGIRHLQTAHIKPIRTSCSQFLHWLVYQCVAHMKGYIGYTPLQRHIVDIVSIPPTNSEEWNGLPLGMILDSGSFLGSFLSPVKKLSMRLFRVVLCIYEHVFLYINKPNI